MAAVRFLRELRRRHVLRVAAGHAVVGGLLIEAATRVFPSFGSPNRPVRPSVLAILAGFPIALGLAFDATPRGSVRADATRRATDSERREHDPAWGWLRADRRRHEPLMRYAGRGRTHG